MYISPDDAKSDVILAGATVLFGGLVLAIVAQLPLYPRTGVLAAVLDLVWILALTAVVPWLLSRYRGDGIAAFGLDGDRSAIAGGIPLALPIVVAQIALVILLGGNLVQAVGGRLGGALGGGGALQAGGPTFLVLQGARFVVLSVGAILLTSFLATRSREAFPRSPEMSLTEMVRTFGMGTAGLAFLVGLLGTLGSLRAFLGMLITVAALVAVLLVADRRIPSRVSVPRATIIAPAVIVLLIHIFASGGFLGGGLINGLYPGALGAGIAIAVSALVQVRAIAWSIVPLLLAAHWWPSLLSPLAF